MGKEYSNTKVTGKLKAWDQNEKAYVIETDNGKTFLARKGSKIPKEYKFNYRDNFELEIGKEKNVGNVWYINAVKNLTGSVATSHTSKSNNGYDSEGQERGNYRNCITTFITAYLNKNGALPSEEDVTVYNNLLKFGEAQALNKRGTEVDKPVSVATATQATDTIPAEGSGVIEASASPSPAPVVAEDVPF